MDLVWLGDLAAAFGGSGELTLTESPSGSLIACAGAVVVKVHHPRTQALLLRARLLVAADPRLEHLLLSPLSAAVHPTPDGRSATVWPRVSVLGAGDDGHPWSAAGALLGRLHRMDPEPHPAQHGERLTEPLAELPAMNPATRLQRALDRVRGASRAALLNRVGSAVLAEIGTAPVGRHLVHGDWHLGQLGRLPGGSLRLLDIDDLGLGDPAWDLARPAGFWAVGLLADQDWDAFLAGYRGAGGPAVPLVGDPWPHLELPARAAVVLAACRAVARPRPDEDEAAEALLRACSRM